MCIRDRVCGQADEEDLQWLDENIRLQEFYLEGGSSRKLLELDNEMHRKLFFICRKELTYEMSQRLAIHYDRIRSLSVAAVKDHKIIAVSYTHLGSRAPLYSG